MYTSSITVDNVIVALGAFLAPFVPGASIHRGQANRAAMAPSPCVYLTELTQVDLSVPDTTYAPSTDSAAIKGPSRIDVQIDFYGVQAGEFCKTFKTAFRSHWAYTHFPAAIKPLYTSDGMQSPLITGEQQYESRWTLTASMQYNPIVTVPQDFADTLALSVAPSDL